ncbi:MAG: amidohydrolase family protein [Vampirovibrionia bacterium]
MVKQLFKVKYLYPVSQPVIQQAAMLIEDGKVIETGFEEDLIENISDDTEVISMPESMIIPGLINAHTHLEYTLLGKLQTKSMVDFLWQTIQQTAKWSENKIRESVKLGLKQCVDSGVTTIGDVSRWGISPLVLSEYPIIADVGLEAFSYDSKSSDQVFELLKNKIEFIRNKISENVKLSISPHSPYNADPRLWELAISYSKANNMLMHSHLAESIEEKNWFEFGKSEIDELHQLIGWPKITPQINSMTPVEYLSTLQLLSSNLLAAHLCYASSRDLELLEDNNVSVIICPRSNLNLHKRIQDYSLLTSLKIKPIIATDGVTSAGNLNILEDIALYNSKNIIEMEDLTKMVTINPAKALKVEKLVGTLEPGKLANFAVFDNIDNPKTWFNSSPSKVYIEGENILNLFKTKI